MSRARDGLGFPRRKRTVRRRCLRRGLNVGVAVLGVWWISTEHREAVTAASSIRATTANWIGMDRAPSLIHDLLQHTGFADGNPWTDVSYVPGSNQRVVWPDRWSDEELSISGPAVPQEQTAADVREEPERPASAKGDVDSEPRGGRDARVGRSETLGAGTAPKAVRAPDRKRVRREWFTVTAYCPCEKCCGRWALYHRTASGLPVTYNGGLLVAADTRILPFRTEVRIPGYADGQPVPVVDRGSAIHGRMIDVFFPTHWRAEQWGRRRLLVEIVP
jgi:3D (Asp-Asp-Asp) domain-containing protein